MPEGDTLYAAQERLRPVLEGQQLTDFWARKLLGHRPRRGFTVEAVRAVGKHLLIDFDRALTLQTHLGMTGSWRVLPPSGDPEAERRRNPKLRVTLSTPLGIACCFAAPTITTFVRNTSHSPIAHLGPNVADPELDTDLLAERLDEFADEHRLLVDVLLDQRIAAGIGNVYKSEVLHLHGFGPDATIAEVGGSAEVVDLFRTAHRLMARNLVEPDARRMTAAAGNGHRGGHFVYGRNRLACRRCETPVRRTVNGVPPRSTYWCPTCQPS